MPNNFVIFSFIYVVMFTSPWFSWVAKLTMADFFFFFMAVFVIYYMYVLKFNNKNFFFQPRVKMTSFFAKFFGKFWGQYVATLMLLFFTGVFFYCLFEPWVVSIMTPPELAVFDPEQVTIIRSYVFKHNDLGGTAMGLRRTLLENIDKKGVIEGYDYSMLQLFMEWVEGEKTGRSKKAYTMASWINI